MWAMLTRIRGTDGGSNTPPALDFALMTGNCFRAGLFMLTPTTTANPNTATVPAEAATTSASSAEHATLTVPSSLQINN